MNTAPGRLRMAAVIVAVAALIISLLTIDQGSPAAIASPTGPMEVPDEWLTAQRLSGDSTFSPADYGRARAAADRSRDEGRRRAPAIVGTSWETRGPTNIGGRITDIAVDTGVPDQLFVAAATGGVWRSSDAGMTYESVWPDDWGQSMGAIAMTGDGVLLAGTGETNPGGGSITFQGDGIYRSPDRGATWEHVGLSDSGSIGRLAVDPSDDSRIFAAVSGNLFLPGGERGVYRTTDGGDTWDQLLPPPNDLTGATEVVIDPTDPQRVYAAMWEHRREPDLRTYGGAGSSLWRSVDGGTTWERMTNGLPSDADQGRWGLAVAPTDGDRLYAYVGTAIGPFRAFYRSDDGGDTWVQMPTSNTLRNSQSSFSWWFGKIFVDPADADNVFVAGVSLVNSVDGGLTWSTSSGVHADQHKMAWDPAVPGRVYLGNDGGMYRSDLNGVTRTWVQATHQPYTQFYSVDVGELAPDRLTGGAQDNGCNRSWYGEAGGWESIGCGDGLQVTIDPENPDIVIGCSQYGSCYRSTNGGMSPRSSIRPTSDRRNWFAPVVWDPSDSDVVYYGGNILNRSLDNGITWAPISPDLSTGVPGRDPSYPWGTITTVAAAPTDGDVIYVGTDDGLLWTTHDGGASWSEVSREQLPGTWVTRVAVHPDSADIAYATFSGFRSGSDRPHVMRTTDGGLTWHDVTGDLPDAPVNSVIATSDGLLIVGSDVGVFLSTWNGGRWTPVGDDLPRAPVTYLRYHEPTRGLTAATFGRGIYTAPIPTCPGVRTRLPLGDPGTGFNALHSCRSSG